MVTEEPVSLLHQLTNLSAEAVFLMAGNFPMCGYVWVEARRKAVLGEVIIGSLLQDPHITSRKPHLFPTSYGNGAYFHCIPVSLSWSLAFWPLHAYIRYQNLSPKGQATHTKLPEYFYNFPSICTFGWWEERRRKEKHLSTLNSFHRNFHATLFINLISIFPSAPLTHSLQVNEKQKVKQKKWKMRFFNLSKYWIDRLTHIIPLELWCTSKAMR